jgi:threonine dehydrogenase-like Zn-dependent dehydrogenase
MSTASTWPTGTMPQLRLTGPGTMEWVEASIPEALPGWVLVRVDKLGICGTDLHLSEGTSAYVQRGLTAYPFVPGHEFCGEVVALGDGVDLLEVGQWVVGEPFLSCGHCAVCRGGHTNLCPKRSELGVRGTVDGAAAQYVRIPQENLAVVPDGVAPEHALMAEPSVTILNSLSSARTQPGDRVAVIGSGTLGLIAVQVAAATGCVVDVIGVDPPGLELALACGAAATYAPGEAPDDTYAVVVEASGAGSALLEASRIAGIGGRIAQAGIPGADSVPVDAAAFVSKGLEMAGVLGGIPFLAKAVGLIAQGSIRPAQLLDQVYDATEFEKAMHAMGTPGRPRPKLVVDLSDVTAVLR